VSAPTRQDIILAGVGGQGILSVAAAIAGAALKLGLNVKQAEVHGMAQRGGAVQSHLRLSRERIWSDLIPRGGADLILAVEPLEALRYLEYLSPGGRVVASTKPVQNIPDYPPLDEILAEIRRLPGSLVVEAEDLAKRAGTTRAQNVVILGAASRYLMVEAGALRETLRELFAHRAEGVLAANLKAFDLGRGETDGPVVSGRR